MRFTHHPRNSDGLTLDWGHEYTQPRPGPKPYGFWLSVDDDWRRWCESERMDHWIGNKTVDFTVDTERVLVLGTPFAIDQFTKEYKPDSEDSPYDGWCIDWERVAEKYAGIIIAPYQWNRRNTMHTMWYYGWDCASACIWDLSVLTQVTRQE